MPDTLMFGRRRGDCLADLNVTESLALTPGGSGTQQIGTASRHSAQTSLHERPQESRALP